MVLAEDGEEPEEIKVLVHISMLKEPSMVALLEMAAQSFGYNQQGVLMVPCDESRFRKMVADNRVMPS
ncbi:hypothetical protein PR202_gb24364 [Eleusine coracana subsp. coracana]|uniref:Uncharacterized protein n=1 Tax=Eleusine coracana subsp. coracana TaxID=191504 RepID=A0AAV5FIH5_ELECO|nr:hypothetical protein PR202_gb24364 [Eleusine coracana subsp. coracana]